MAFAEPNTEIHFTTNGAEPTATDAMYKHPLSITTNFTTVKARVFSKIYQASDVVAATFIKDGLPIKSVECTPPNPKYTGSGAPTLIDGGNVTVPTFRMYDPDGNWFKEGHGVDPDIEVLEDPTTLSKGVDVQLEKAIEEVMRLHKLNPPVNPKQPP